MNLIFDTKERPLVSAVFFILILSAVLVHSFPPKETVVTDETSPAVGRIKFDEIFIPDHETVIAESEFSAETRAEQAIEEAEMADLFNRLSKCQQSGMDAFYEQDFKTASASLGVCLDLIEANANWFDIGSNEARQYTEEVNDWLGAHKDAMVTVELIEHFRDRIGELRLPVKGNPFFDTVLRQYLDNYLLKIVADSQR